MHRHRAMYNNVYRHHPLLPYHHHGLNVCSSYDISDTMPMASVRCCGSPHCSDYGCRHSVSCIDYSYNDCVPRVVPPPVTLTNIRNDIRYFVDDPEIIYDDDYGEKYRLSRSKIQLVDFVPKNSQRTNSNRFFLSKNISNKPVERVIVPHSIALRQRSLPAYEWRRPVHLVPLYHYSGDRQYIVPHRRPMPRKVIPLVTVHNPTKRTIKIRSLSP